MLVADSSFLVAAYNRADAHHEAAQDVWARFREGQWAHMLIPDVILFEACTVLQVRTNVREGLRLMEHLLRAEEAQIVATAEFVDRVAMLHPELGSQGLSLFDTAVVVTARAHGATDVATFDRGFARVTGIQTVP